MMRVLQAITLVALYFIFSAASLVATFLIPLALPFNHRYAGNLLKAKDKELAGVLGWDGKNTVSKECGRDSSCRFCRIVCKILHYVLEPNHCEKEAAE
jgi:hypothetical protein